MVIYRLCIPPSTNFYFHYDKTYITTCCENQLSVIVVFLDAETDHIQAL